MLAHVCVIKANEMHSGKHLWPHSGVIICTSMQPFIPAVSVYLHLFLIKVTVALEFIPAVTGPEEKKNLDSSPVHSIHSNLGMIPQCSSSN